MKIFSERSNILKKGLLIHNPLVDLSTVYNSVIKLNIIP